MNAYTYIYCLYISVAAQPSPTLSPQSIWAWHTIIEDNFVALVGEAMNNQESCPTGLSHRMYLIFGFRKSTPPKNGQLIVYCYSLKDQVDGFVRELAFWNLFIKTLCQM